MAADLIKAVEVKSMESPLEVVEEICARWYDASRRQALRLIRPNFARKRASISRVSEDPAFEYSDQYQLPNDYIVLMGIRDLSTPLSMWDYSIEDSGKLLINYGNASSLPIIYVSDHTEVGRWDSLFKKAVAFELAINIAYSITGQKTLVTTLVGLRSAFIAETRAINGQERPPKYVINSAARSARMRYSNTAYGSTRSSI
ncbi:MAG: hypothetical protein EOL91_04185 [Actinobacteria bacterium]|nr:hypothetical protein [Actinomycetota bacterium]